MPKRVVWKRTRGWRKPPGAVYVGRPSRWMNPYKVGALVSEVPDDVLSEAEVIAADGFLSQKDAVDCFRAALHMGRLHIDVADVEMELSGKDLGCWCAEGTPCHGDVLLRVANHGARVPLFPDWKPKIAYPDWFNHGTNTPIGWIKNVHAGRHPTGAALLEPWGGERCKTCAHKVALRANKSYWKCGLDIRRWTHGLATDIRLKWRACDRYETDKS